MLMRWVIFSPVSFFNTITVIKPTLLIQLADIVTKVPFLTQLGSLAFKNMFFSTRAVVNGCYICDFLF
jgi:hypothetical protein